MDCRSRNTSPERARNVAGHAKEDNKDLHVRPRQPEDDGYTRRRDRSLRVRGRRSPSPQQAHRNARSPSRSLSPGHKRRRSRSRSRIPDRRHRRQRSYSYSRSRSRSRSPSPPPRGRRHYSRSPGHPHHSRSRSRDNYRRKDKGRHKRPPSPASSSSNSGSEHHKKKKHRSERRKRRKDKKEKKKSTHGSSSARWGKYGIISETDLYNKTHEFRTWLLEERKLNPEALSKDQERKEFQVYVEDYNTATLPHEKYYHMEAYDRRMASLRAGEFVPPADDAYDPTADMKAHAIRHKKSAAEKDSYLSREQLMELRKVQNERIEIGRMKRLGMDIKQNMGVRMDGTMFDE